MLRALSLVLLLGGLFVRAAAQSDPEDLLRRAVLQVRDTVDRLPKYMCTQTIERRLLTVPPGERKPNPCDARPATGRLQLIHSDRLRLDVASTSTGEMYSWVGEGRFHDEELSRMVRQGFIGDGGFISFLTTIFVEEGIAEFSYHGETRVEGRQLQEFGFRVPLEKSLYRFGLRRHEDIVAYEGTFLVDPQTADLVRLIVIVSEPPADTGACQSTTTLDYGHTRLRDADLLLPKEIRLDVVHKFGMEARNRTLFSNCHEFLGESKLSFGAPQPGPASSEKPPAPSGLALPAGLPFRIAFTEDIDADVAAAGDTVAAKLTTAIKDAEHRVLLPAGTPLTTRILQTERNYSPNASGVELTLLFRLEAAVVDGTACPFLATAEPDLKTYEKNKSGLIQNRPLGTLDAILDPGAARLRLWNAPQHYVIKSGTASNWTTGARYGSQ